MSAILESLLDPLLLGALAASLAFLWVIWKLLTSPIDSDRDTPGPERDDASALDGGAPGDERPPAGTAPRTDESGGR